MPHQSAHPRIIQRQTARSLRSLLVVFLILMTVAITTATGQDSPPSSSTSAAEYDKKLEQLESAYSLFPLNEKNKRNLADAYAAYGNVMLSRKQYEQADHYFQKGAELYPDSASFSLPRGICNYYLKRYDIARYELERAQSQQPDSVDVLYFLGLVLYETDFRHPAIKVWEQALALSPGNPVITSVLEKHRKETFVEEGMDRNLSSRFNLTYDPGVDGSFAQAVLDVLENAANQVGADLGHFPVARVPVAIYKRGDYKTVTDSPDWSGGVYDGTIRLPFGSAAEITPQLRSILYHEYAHVVVFDLSRGNCPVWFNEGIAESFGRRELGAPPNHYPASVLSKATAIDFSRLERGFGGLSAQEAMLAYEQSYSIVNYVAATYGWHRITALLTLQGKGKSFRGAVADVLGDYSLTYEGLIAEWRATLP